MVEEYGLVRQEASGKLQIQVIAPGACDACPIHDNCYSAGKTLWIPKQEGIGVNEYVRFSITNTSVLKITALVYGIPLLGVLGGIILGYLWLFNSMPGDPRILLSVLLGVVLFGLSAFGVSRMDRSLRDGLSYEVVRADPPAGNMGQTVPRPTNREDTGEAHKS